MKNIIILCMSVLFFTIGCETDTQNKAMTGSSVETGIDEIISYLKDIEPNEDFIPPRFYIKRIIPNVEGLSCIEYWKKYTPKYEVYTDEELLLLFDIYEKETGSYYVYYIIKNWLSCNPLYSHDPILLGDITGDGITNLSDFNKYIYLKQSIKTESDIETMPITSTIKVGK